MESSRIIKLTAAAAGALFPWFLVAPNRNAARRCAEFKGINYAHRGLHNREKTVPENSMAAFRLAAQAGYGIELDVHLTRDGQLVVFHDDTLDRVCGHEGRVEDFSYEGLCRFTLCQTEERIPRFADVLENIDGASALIVELKAGRDKIQLCEKVYQCLKAYKGSVCVESFDPVCVAWFRKNAPEIVRGQLSMSKERYYPVLSKAKSFVASRCLLNFLARPDFIAYEIGKKPIAVRMSELMGAASFGWTALDDKSEDKLDGVIFQYYAPKARFRTDARASVT